MSVGKPDAGNQHVRFDERGRETERGSSEHSHRARPRLYSTGLMLCADADFGRVCPQRSLAIVSALILRSPTRPPHCQPDEAADDGHGKAVR